MFAKLLKYEWKSTYRLLGTLSLCALGAGLLGAAALQGFHYATTKLAVQATAGFLIVICSLILMGLYFALIAYVMGTQFYLIYRFYKTRFTDQGYLTFTLPVSSRSVILSAYLNNLIWILITVVTALGAVALAVGLGSLGYADSLALWEGVRYALAVSQTNFGGSFPVVSLLFGLTALASGMMLMMASVIAGAVAAKKHKILAAIGIYYGQSIVLGILTVVAQVASVFIFIASGSSTPNYSLLYGTVSLVQAAWALGAYFLARNLVDKKLNLP